MKLTITIDSENDGVNTDQLVAAVVRQIANKIAAGEEFGRAKDYNGNTVGSWEYERTEREDEEEPEDCEEEDEEEPEDCEEEDEDDEVTPPTSCPACGREGCKALGALGNSHYYRCAWCGVQFSPSNG